MLRFCLFRLHVSRKLFQVLLGLFLLVGNKDKCRHSRFICNVVSMVEDHAKLDSLAAQGNCRWNLAMMRIQKIRMKLMNCNVTCRSQWLFG